MDLTVPAHAKRCSERRMWDPEHVADLLLAPNNQSSLACKGKALYLIHVLVAMLWLQARAFTVVIIVSSS